MGCSWGRGRVSGCGLDLGSWEADRAERSWLGSQRWGETHVEMAGIAEGTGGRIEPVEQRKGLVVASSSVVISVPGDMDVTGFGGGLEKGGAAGDDDDDGSQGRGKSRYVSRERTIDMRRPSGSGLRSMGLG